MEWRCSPHYIYQCFQQGQLVYVGCTADPESRVKGLRRSPWWTPETSVAVTHALADRREAYCFENSLIRSLRPRHNVQGNPDAAARQVPAQDVVA